MWKGRSNGPIPSWLSYIAATDMHFFAIANPQPKINSHHGDSRINPTEGRDSGINWINYKFRDVRSHFFISAALDWP